MTWVNAVVQGVALGGLYALYACGLSLMFGVMRIINLAHGDITVLGAFIVWLIVDCCATAAEGIAAAPSSSAASTFFMPVPLAVRSMALTVAPPPWLFAERLVQTRRRPATTR